MALAEEVVFGNLVNILGVICAKVTSKAGMDVISLKV